MNYNININQKAIAELNLNLKNKLDLKDATILEWMLKFHAEPKAKKLMIHDQVYFWGAYQLIIDENPLLEIKDKDVLARKINKLISVGLIHKHLSKEKGNKTYFCITQKCFDLIKRDKSTLTVFQSEASDQKEVTLTVFQSDNNNIIDNDIIITISEKLKNNQMLVETMQMRYGKKVDVLAKIDEFERFCVSTEKIHSNNHALFYHFTNWLSINANKTSKSNVDNEITWFIEMFNKISKGNFKVTNDIEALFVKQLSSGFTGKEMAVGVRNMFSIDDRNEWHKKTAFKYATPRHFLKDDNVNTYLNQRF